LIGAGFIAGFHLAGIRDCGQAAQVRLVAARSKHKAQALAQTWGIESATDNWREILGRSDIHAVIIATPDHTHEAIACEVAQAGKAILLQKPMAGSVASCRRIIAAADAANIDLQVSFMHRHFEEVLAARQLLEQGIIGRLHSVRIRNATPGPDWGDWFFDPHQVGNGVIDQLGVHGIDLVQHLLGPIETVSARTATLLPERKLADGRVVAVNTIDTALASYALDGGRVLVTHEMSMIEAQGCDRFRLELYGDKGTIWLRTERGPLAIWAPHEYGSTWHVQPLAQAPLGARQHARWIAALQGQLAPENTAVEALAGMQVVEAIQASARRDSATVPVAR
jgi:predicted dehydrogenase